MRKKKIKTKSKAIFLVVILIIAVLAFADYLWQKDLKNTADQKNEIITSSNTPSISIPKSNPASTEIITVSTTTPKSQPLSFKTDAPKISAVRELDGIFNYQVTELKARADNCGTSYSESHFENLVAEFKQSPKIFYTFKYRSANTSNSDESVYSVTILPNKAGYKNIEEFKKDFELCGAGGVDNPFMLNKDWLLFVSSCGSGFDDGSGRINSCEEARKIIEPSLKLK